MFSLKNVAKFASCMVFIGMVFSGCAMFKVKPTPPTYSL
jgi:hypothetical protein